MGSGYLLVQIFAEQFSQTPVSDIPQIQLHVQTLNIQGVPPGGTPPIDIARSTHRKNLGAC